MTQQIQIGARLSPATTGTSIGYRIDTLAGVEHAAFTTSGVVELDIPGSWLVTSLVTVPDAGCVVYWGTSGSYLIAESYGPLTAVNVAQISGDATAADNLESAADGTGYNLGGGAVVAESVTAGVTLASGAITAAVIATNAIDADAIAPDAVTELQSGLATPTNITAGTITTVTNLTNAPTNGDLTATMKASVNAEVLDVLNVDTFAEPTSAPAATSSLRAKIGWIFKVLRNRMTQSTTTQTLYADDGTTADNTSATSSTGSAFERGEWS